MTDAPPPTARRQETRSRLLDAATLVFAEEGLQGASVEGICSRAGFTRGAFYSNFESKEQLFLALLEREFNARAQQLAEKAVELEPLLREHGGRLTPETAARYVADFVLPPSDDVGWFALETEFLLLAIRDRSLAPGHDLFMDRFFADISGLVERVVTAAGRQFTLPVERALPVLGGLYERALRHSALAGADHSAFEGLGERITELLFALTEPSPSTSSGADGRGSLE